LIGEVGSHGYSLLSAVKDLTGACVDNAALYRALRSLEDDGVVESHWVAVEAGPQRREYQLTDDGRELVGWWREELSERSRVCTEMAARAQHVLDASSTDVT
jgi:PadR family transcriptional regulator, regulatory protein PadR